MLFNALKQAASSLVRREKSEFSSLNQNLIQARESLAFGNQPDAEQRYLEIVASRPSCAEAHHMLGRIKGMRGELADAEDHLKQAVQLAPNLAEAWADLGNVHKFAGRTDEAVSSYQTSLHFDPTQAVTWYNLGLCQREQKLARGAAVCFDKALELNPEFSPALRSWVALQNELHLYDETRSRLEIILQDFPEYAEAHAALGFLLVKRFYEPDAALAHFEEAKELGLADAELWGNRGIALQDLGHIEQAIESYNLALNLEPENHSFRFHRGLAYLLNGDFAKGWPDYEFRLLSEDLPRRDFSLPRWQGESLQGRNILIYAEQGLGDEIMFASCLPDIVAQSEHCVIDCHKKLEPIFRRSFPSATVHGGSQFDPVDWMMEQPELDVCIPIGSLPLYVRQNRADFPSHAGYLKADETRVAYWSERLGALGEGNKIGISWRGGTNLTRRSVRSLGLDQLLPLLSRQDLHFVSLQYDADEAEIHTFNQQNENVIHHWPEALADYDETAALVSALDLIVSVCSSVIHLGGALGKPVWVMAPRVPEWRYGVSGQSILWYPTSKLFRQVSHHVWSEVIDSVVKQFETLKGIQNA